MKYRAPCIRLKFLLSIFFSLLSSQSQLLWAQSLIEAQKEKEEEIEVQIELHPKVILALKRYTTAIELLPMRAP